MLLRRQHLPASISPGEIALATTARTGPVRLDPRQLQELHRELKVVTHIHFYLGQQVQRAPRQEQFIASSSNISAIKILSRHKDN